MGSTKTNGGKRESQKGRVDQGTPVELVFVLLFLLFTLLGLEFPFLFTLLDLGFLLLLPPKFTLPGCWLTVGEGRLGLFAGEELGGG